MVFKFYEYDNLDIVPNKLKSAKLVKSIDIYAPQTITPLGCNITTKENISANIAEYTHQGVKYVCYCTFTGMGNNMYNYRLDVDALATAWYANCFDRYNMVARSNLGNFKNDNALLRDTQQVIHTYECSDNVEPPVVLITVLTQLPNPSSNRLISGIGTDTYLMTLEQFKGFYYILQGKETLPDSSRPAPGEMTDFLTCILNIVIADGEHVDKTKFSTASKISLTNTSKNNRLAIWNITNLKYTDGQEHDPGMPKVLNRVATSLNSSKNIQCNLGSNNYIDINEDTILGNISIDIRHCGNISIPISAINKNETQIKSVGYNIKFDYKTGNITCYPNINGTVYYNYALNNKTPESLPILYDNTINNWSNTIGSALGGSISVIGNAAMLGSLSQGSKQLIPMPSLWMSGIGALYNPIMTTALSTIAGNALNAFAGASSNNITGTAYKFSAGSDTYRTQSTPSIITISYTPTVNKSSYQDRFGKADMTSRNITQLTGPVQTINCVASMNNLNQSIIQSATTQCDNGIWIL